ncbi:MAG: hypothetical protein PHU71_04370 [Candidatus Gracilibacteria bacterium]|nr:hypothetical protein [Candidatus Gracilibacteria bacterium]
MSKRLNLSPGEQYGTDDEICIEILRVEIRETSQGLRRAIAKVLGASQHWQQWVRIGQEVKLDEIMDVPETQETHWNLVDPRDLWFILHRRQDKTHFEHYR